MTPGTPRLTRLNDQLFTSADLPQWDGRAWSAELDRWEALGITHVVDNRIEASDLDLLAEYAPAITYLENGADDAGQRMPDAWFDRGVDFTLEAMADPSAKVHVHCHMGINRGPSMAFAVLLATGMSPAAGVRTIRDARPRAAIGYAGDALSWWHRRSSASAVQRRQQRTQLRAFWAANPHHTVRVIQEVRDEEMRGLLEAAAIDRG